MSIPSGVHTNLPEKEYRAVEAINQSTLKEILRSPAHYQATLKSDWTPSSSMMFGTALHCFLLEPQHFNDRFASSPEGVTDRRTKEWKAFEKDVGDRTVISFEDRTGFDVIKKQIETEYQLHELMSEGLSETTLIWEDSQTGLKCKARLDFVTPKDIIVDLKSTKDARQWSFSRSIYDFGYHFQAAFYSDALALLGGKHRGQIQFKFLVVENTRPWSVQLYRLDPKAMDIGRHQYQTALQTLKKCQDLNQWPGYTVKEEVISLPSFAMGE